jgi:quinoprotein glucose dehydrogenase
MRIEALDMLATWATPGDRDRVMNRHMPLSERSAAVASKVLRDRIEELSAASDAVRDKFVEVGASLGLTEITKLILKTAQDKSVNGSRRAAAIKALATLDANSLQPLLKELLVDSNVDVRIASLTYLVKSAPDQSIGSLQTAIQSKEIRERQNAWDQIGTLSSDAGKKLIAEGVRSYLDGSLPRDCWLNVIEASKQKLDGDLSKLLEAKFAGLEKLKESDPKKYYEDSVDGGNVERGRTLFFTRTNLSCVRCHKVGATGGEVGPNLSELGSKKDREYLLEAIVAPNSTIAQGFETIVILDENGQTTSGILKSEDDTIVKLMDPQGAIIEIEKDSIEARRKGLSSMPADLVTKLSKRELRDLVAYLSSLDGSPAATAGLNDTEGGHKVE